MSLRKFCGNLLGCLSLEKPNFCEQIYRKVSRFIEILYLFISIYSTELCPEVGFVHLSQMSANQGRYQHLIAVFFRIQLLLVLILCT